MTDAYFAYNICDILSNLLTQNTSQYQNMSEEKCRINSRLNLLRNTVIILIKVKFTTKLIMDKTQNTYSC